MYHNNSREFKMEHTLDPIRPSDSDWDRGEMSYLYGRDPSILAHSRRPGLSADTRKNLCSLYEIEESMRSETTGSLTELSSQTVKVYLRMKPYPRNAKLTKQQELAYHIPNSTTLITKLPPVENPTVSMIKSAGVEAICRRYKFTEAFGPEISQLDFFDQVIKSQMSDFILGQNCTVMTYGTTNSGKSYTLQGTTASPGIIPRGLEFVFANINPKSSPSYKPIRYCDVAALSAAEKTQELDIKNKLLASGLTDKNQYIAAYKQMQKLLEEESSIQISQPSDAHYSVWVSFAEIYNETIFDLLSNECQKRRPSLKLATDSFGRAFIKGLKTVCVNSGSEAYQVLMAGQYNLKVAATALNSRSSRSHCIFTIKLMKYFKENNPESVEVSTFAFCDLAGSERLKKTLNVGDRLKEAQNINTSLLVLGRCLKSIYEGQSVKHRNDHVGPFRESKLTRLFQQALSGNEPIALIVNVNPSPNLYIETQNVLNFAAIAKKIILQPKKTKCRKSRSRFSQVVEQNTKSIIDWDDTAELESIPEHSSITTEECPSVHSEDYEDLLNENEILRKEISALKASTLNRDFEIRQQMATTYSEMLKKVEDHYKNQLKDVEEQQEDLMEYNVHRVESYWKEKLNQAVSRKRSRSEVDEDYDEDDVVDVVQLEAENTALTNKVTSLKATLKDIRKQKDSLESAKNTAEYELSLVKEDLKRVKNLMTSMQSDLTSNGEQLQCIEELQKQLAELNEKNKGLKSILNEAKQDYIDVKAEIDNKDRQIEERDNMIIIQTEKLQDLESQFENTNSVLSERIKHNDELEEKLERQTEQLIDAEERITQLENALKNNDSKEIIVEINDSCYEGRNNKDEIVKELEEKLKKYESENLILSEKLSARSCEMKSMKCDLKAAKNCMSDLNSKLTELEMYRTLKMETSGSVRVQPNIQIKMEEREYYENECQTTSTEALDQINQTSFIDTESENLNEKLTNTEKELEKIVQDCNKLQEKLKKEEEYTSKLVGQLNTMKHEYKELQEKLKNVGEDTSKSFVDQLNKMEQDYSQLRKKLENEEEHNSKLLEQLNDGKTICEKLTAEVEVLKTTESDLKKTVEELKEEAQSNAVLCQTEHMEEITRLKNDLFAAEQSNVTHKELIQKYCTEMDELKQKSNEVQRLQNKLMDLDSKLETLQLERTDLLEKLEDKMKKIELNNCVAEKSAKEIWEKDEEIKRLQKEVKTMLQSTANDESTMEKELKKCLKDLEDTKQDVLFKTRFVEELELKITELKITKNTVDDCNRQIVELKNTIQTLRKELDLKDQDMEQFKRNRDDLIRKYEESLTSCQEELSRIKQENIEYKNLSHMSITTPRTVDKNQKFCAPSSDRVYYNLRENKQPREKGEVSDDEVVTERRGRRNRKILEPPTSPNIDEVQVIELSGSESKRTTRGTEKKVTQSESRPRRKKKLYTASDDSFTDIIPVSEPSPSPMSSRSLRTRRK